MTKLLLKTIIYTVSIISAGCVTTGISHKPVYAQIGEVVTAHGEYIQQIGDCRMTLKNSSMGGYSVLSVNHLGTKEIDDVTGLDWVSPTLLVYTVSPIYGKPGVYVYDCVEHKSKRIVAPKNISTVYADGADYFELYQVDGSTIFFYYAPDVDLVNFSEFRTQSFLFRVNLDGSDFTKVKSGE